MRAHKTLCGAGGAALGLHLLLHEFPMLLLFLWGLL